MIKLPIMALLLAITACHPLVVFSPKPIKSTHLNKGDDNIRITVDSMGLPYIKASSIHDVMYGLGFMHSRDRLFQLDLIRHAAQGRLGELFGERVHALDKGLRVLTYRLDEQVEKLSKEEDLLIEHYIAGVNEGARQRGRTAEHFLLGLEFADLTKRDVLGIARLQSWQLAADLHSEIARLKIARTDISAAAKEELLAAIDDRGSAIIDTAANFAERFTLPSYLKRRTSPQAHAVQAIDDIVQMAGGASNAWVINGRLAKGGNAMLMNDPHLQHSWPSNFYLATLEADDFFVTGATFVGLPGVLVGATKRLAWGVTASLLNTQDAVLLKMADGDDKFYIVDGKKLPLIEWPQSYCSNKKGVCKDVMHYASIYGPIIDADTDNFVDKGDRFAVQWTGFAVDEHKSPSGDFLTLAQAHDVAAGIAVVKSMSLPGVNIVLADNRGNIGYAYAGLVPKRDARQHPYLPLDGERSSSLWSGFLKPYDEPSAINPSSGYIVTANQNIYRNDAHPDLVFGKQGGPPYRALRINERIASMLKGDELIDFDTLSEVQIDDMSVEARELAPLLGSICAEQWRDKDGYRQTFARAVKSFDGRYTKDSKEALPYEMLIDEVVTMRLKSILNSDDAEERGHLYQLRYAIKNALQKELTGDKTAIFASAPQGNAKSLVEAACEPAFQHLVKRASKSQWAWRWGRHHYLKRQSPIAKAPFIGGFFRDKKREVAGSQSSPMAEAGLPVRYGANLRFRVKLTDPPEIHAVIDAGNSGTIGEKNAFDQAALWHDGKYLRMDTDWASAMAKSKSYFELVRSSTSTKK
jgi:penicillin amidase